MNTGAPSMPRGDLLRGILVERFRRTCQYCKRESASYLKDPDGFTWNIEHVKPISRGGTHTEDNLVLACQSCNFSKGDRSVPKLPRAQLDVDALLACAPETRLRRGGNIAQNALTTIGQKGWHPIYIVAVHFLCTVGSVADYARSNGLPVWDAAGVAVTNRDTIVKLTERFTGYSWADLCRVKIWSRADAIVAEREKDA